MIKRTEFRALRFLQNIENYHSISFAEGWTISDFTDIYPLGSYRKHQKLRVKGYISASDFTELLSNPYRRIQVNASESYVGWIESLTYEPNSSERELELIYF